MAVTENLHTGNGSKTNYAFTFPYLNTTDIKASVDGTVVTNFTAGTPTATEIQFNTAPANNAAIRIYRDTATDKLSATFFAGSAIKSQDLNDNFLQNLYVTQEAKRDADAAWQDGDETIHSTETWVSNNTKVATTGAIDGRVDTKIDTALTTDVSGGDGVTIVDNSPGSGQIRVDLDADIATLKDMQSGAATQLAALTSAELAILDGATVTTAEVNLLDGVTATTAELNILDGVTANKDELNLLDGVTATTAELNILDGVTATTAEINTLDGVTATTAELNILDGVTATTAELNILDGVTATTDELNKTDGLTSTPVELNILDGATVNTSEINKLDGVTASTAELNIVAGKSFKTSSGTLDTTSDTEIPSSKVIAAHVASSQTAIGGFTTIADEVSFPNTQPANGVVVSINNAAGVVVNGSGVSTTGKRVDNTTVTINGFPSSLYGETLAAGVGLIVVSTSTANTYNYHKILSSETDVKQLSDDINDFNARYRIASSAPGSNNDEGDLYFDTAANKMKVYNGSAWDDVASVGSFFINTLSSSSGTGGGSATFNGSAYRFTLSNAGTSAQQLIVSVNGVIQKPNTGTSQPSEGFAVDGNDIIFSAAPDSSSDYFIVTCGSSVSIGTPSANSVNSSHIIDGSIVNGDISSTANIAGSKVADDSIPEGKLDVHNAPATGKYLKYTSNGMEWSDGASEGTDVKSTGESGTTKFLRVDGDGTCSWQVPPDTNTQLTLHDEDNFASNSATAAASQQSIKAYVDTQVGSISSAPQITANASGALAAGDKVVVNSNGTVSKIKNTYTEKSSYTYLNTGSYADTTATYPKVCHDSNNGKLYAFYTNTANTRGEIAISDGSYANWKTPQEVAGNDMVPFGIAWSTTSERGLLVWRQSTGLTVRAFKLDSGGESVTFGNQINVLGGGNNSDHVDISWDKTADKFLIVVGKNASDNFPDASGARNNTIAFVVSVNDVTCTRGTPTVMSSQDHQGMGLSVTYDPDNNKHIAVYGDYGNSEYLTAAILTISGTTVTANTEVADSIATYDTDIVYVGGGDFVLYYEQNDNDTKARFITVSGTTPSFGTATSNINSSAGTLKNNNIQAAYDERTEKVSVSLLSSSGPRDGRIYWLTLNKTNHTISVNSSYTAVGSSRKGSAMCYDSTNNQVVWLQTDNNNNSASTAYITVDVSTNLSTAYIGTSAGSYADGAAATINIVGSTDSNQSGLTAGVKYFINNDGTLSISGGDTKVFAGTAVSASKIIVNEGPQDYSPMVLLEKKVIGTSNGANIDFDGFVSDEYDSYILKIYGLTRNPPTMTDTFAVRLRWYFSNTLYTSSTYYWDATGRTFGYNTSPVNTGGSGANTGNGNTAQDYIQCHLTTSVTCYTGELEFPNLGQANAQKFVRGWMGDQKSPWLNGQHSDFWGKEKNSSNTNENKCTGFRLYEPTNEFRGGTLKLYGLK